MISGQKLMTDHWPLATVMKDDYVNITLKSLVVGLTAVMIFLCAGCASQKDPYGTDLPWTDTQPWERAPVLPGGIGR